MRQIKSDEIAKIVRDIGAAVNRKRIVTRRRIALHSDAVRRGIKGAPMSDHARLVADAFRL